MFLFVLCHSSAVLPARCVVGVMVLAAGCGMEELPG
ncbi:hypothetical protein KR100_04890 [Synechococcus sp. KORDI-100]|nr:hypothetical protein KR100_04890 [Synechococcus sp. KORDI-100]